MNNENKDKVLKKNDGEKKNTTKYGEFVCSNYQWLPLEIQKEKAQKMNDMTKNKNSK